MQTGDSAVAGQPADEGLPTPRYLGRFWQQSAAMMSVMDDDGFVILRNPAHQAVLGWSDEEIRSVPYWVLVHPDDREGLVEGGSQCSVHEARLLTSTGEYRHVVASVDRDDRTLYMIGFDTSQAADRPVERARVGTWRSYVAADVTTFSPGMFDIYGLAPDTELSYELAMDCIHPDDRKRTDDAVRWSLATGEPYECEFRVVHDDGSPRWVHAAARVYLDDKGDPAQMLGIAQDVTDRRKRAPRGRPRPFLGPIGPESG